jgi:hypothetical protein
MCSVSAIVFKVKEFIFLIRKNRNKFANKITTYAGNLFENVENCKLLKKKIGRS